MIKDHQINKNRSIPEIFDHVRTYKSKANKVTLLKKYDNRHLRWFVNAMYNVDWSEMEVPKYKPSPRPPEISHQSIGTAIPRIEQAYRQRFNRPEQTERLLLLVLEEMSAPEAELLVHVFNGKKRIEGVSKHVFKEVYPDLFRFPEKNESNDDVSQGQV